MESITTGSSES